LDFIETCRRFIGIDSSPKHGSRESAEFAAKLCRERGLDVELQEEVHDGLQQFKRGWGLSPFPDPLSLVAAVWVGSDVVRQAFAQQPVLAESGAGLRVYTGE
jgi:hypothetical protein